MSSCILEAKREHFASSSTSCVSSSGSSSAGSPILFKADDENSRLSPFDSFSHSFGSSTDDRRQQRVTTTGTTSTPTTAAAISPGSERGNVANTPTPSQRSDATDHHRRDSTNIAAIYEQPMAKALPLIAAKSRTSTARMTTFKVAAPSPNSISSHRRKSNGRNSVESTRSRSSSSSTMNGVYDEPFDQLHTRTGRPSLNSIKVATRYVSPPEIPSEAGVKGASCDHRDVTSSKDLQTQSVADTWHSVPLNDDNHNRNRTGGGGQKKQLCPAEHGLSSILIAKFKGQTTKTTANGGITQAKGQFNRANQNRNSSPASNQTSKLCLSVDANGCKQTRHTKSVSSASGGNDKLTGFSDDLSSLSGFEQQKRKSSTRSCSSSCKQQIGKQGAPFMFAGILASILGSVFFSMGILTIKLLPDGHGLAEKTKIACWRGFIMMILCSATIIKSKCSFLVPREEILINVLRSVFGFLGIYMSYMSLKYISMGDATALVFSSPVWTSLLSHFILHEPLQWIQLIALPLSLLGIVLIAHPSLIINMEHKAGPLEKQPVLDIADVLSESFATIAVDNNNNNNDTLQQATANSNYLAVASMAAQQLATNIANGTTSAATSNHHLTEVLNQDLDIAMNTTEHFDYEHRWKGIVIALATSLVVSFIYIVLKFRKSTPIQVATFWLAATTFSGSLFIGLFVGFGEFPTKGTELGLLVFNGVCSWLGQCLLQWALAYEDASVLSVIRTLDVAMSFSLSAIFLDEEILWTSILGASIIAAVVVSIMLSGYIQTKLCGPKEAETRSPPSLSCPPQPRFSISSVESACHEFNNKISRPSFVDVNNEALDSKSHGHPLTPFDLATNKTKTATVGA